MADFLKENYLILTILGALATQLWSAAKLVARNEATIAELNEFKKDFNRHLERFNELAEEVSYLKGRASV